MHTYQFNSFLDFTMQDMDTILKDTQLNKQTLIHIQSLLKYDHIININWVRILNANRFQLITQLSKELLLEYFHSGLWKSDMVIQPNRITTFKIIDYIDINPDKKYSSTVSHSLTLIITKKYQEMYDTFTFDISKEYFSSMDEEQKILLHERLSIAIDMLYKYVFFKHSFEMKEHKVFKTLLLNSNEEEILKTYKLTQLGLDYLKLLAAGNTAKEIAIHLNRSHRTVQEKITWLCDKFSCSNKEMLVYVAKMITSYIR